MSQQGPERRASLISKLLTELDIPEKRWKHLLSRLPLNFDYSDILQDVVASSSKTGTVFLCFEDYTLLQYGGFISYSYDQLINPRVGQRIRGKNEIVDPSARLEAASLRRIFVYLEALVYKCVHLKLEQQRSDYSERKEDYKLRLTRLLDEKLITEDTHRLAGELYKTRNQFAHSLRPIDQLKYLSVELTDRWGAAGTTRQRDLKRYFLSDVYDYSEALLDVFKPVQFEQLNGEAFLTRLNELIGNVQLG